MNAAVLAPEEEVTRLRRCLNDLISVMALPAVWATADPEQIASTLSDALLGMLRLAWVFVRLNDPDAGTSLEMSRVTGTLDGGGGTREISGELNAALGPSPIKWPASAHLPIRGSDYWIACARIGIDGDIGIVVAGAQRPAFPEQGERLVLDVAANQAAIRLQQARLFTEQTRVATELDQLVAQRTSELTAVNDELKRSERESRLIIDSIPGLVALLSPRGSIDMANRQLLEYLGQTLEEFGRWGINDTVHPEDLPHVLDVFSRSIAAGVPYEVLHRFRRGDGVYRWFQSRGLPHRDADGNIARWSVLLTDIEDRKRAEEALESRGQDLKLIIDTIPTLSWSTDPSGSVDFLSTPWLDFTGLSAEEAHGFGWSVAIHPGDAPGLLQYWQAALDAGTQVDVEARIRRYDGVYRWFLFRANPFRDETGKIIKWYGTNIDIEDRKRAEEGLRRNDAFLAKAQRLSATGSFSWRLDADEITFSEEAYRIFEFDHTIPVTFERIAECVHPEDLPSLAEKIKVAHRVGEGHDYEIRLRMPDGSLKYLHTTFNETRDANGLREYIGAIQDVTQRRLAQEALGKARDELAHVSRVTSLSALTASIAHEINQPLSGIITNAGTCLRMLNADPPNVDGARETVRRTIRDGNRASDVITRLRALFSKKEFTVESLDLNEAAREVVALSFTDLQRNQVIVQSELADDVPLVTGDRIQLQQVILNLLRNAVDAMANVHDRPRRLLIRTECEKNGCVRLSVRDAGIGLDGQNMDRLFDSFYTTKSGGMGIGLSVSRSIIERHHGRLWAEHHEGPGATFSFSIPSRPENITDTEQAQGNS